MNYLRNKQQKMIHYDKQSDVLYFGIKPGIEEEFVEVSPGINVELDAAGKVIGVEVLNASKVLKSIINPLYRQALNLPSVPVITDSK